MKTDFGLVSDFIARYDELKSSRKMGEFYGCNKATVTRHAKKIGYDYNKNHVTPITDEDRKRIVSLYYEKTSTELATEYNVSGSMISKIWADAGCKGKKMPLDRYHFNDLKNRVFGYLTVVEKTDQRDSGGGIIWKCSCGCNSSECKKEVYASSGPLIGGRIVSCGSVSKNTWRNNLTPGEAKDRVGEQYGLLEVIERGANSSNGVTWICRCSCGRTSQVLSSNLKEDASKGTKSCGKCGGNSKGNIKINKLLTSNNILFEEEKRFKSCKNTRELPFDFYIPAQNYCIEFDGIQHYEEVLHFGSLEETQKRDAIKTKWCKENNIPLIRIPYSHLNEITIEDLLLDSSSFIC